MVDSLQRALAADAYNSSHPLYNPGLYFIADITYSKVRGPLCLSNPMFYMTGKKYLRFDFLDKSTKKELFSSSYLDFELNFVKINP